MVFPGQAAILQPASAARSASKSKVALDFAVAAIRAGDLGEARRLLHERLAEDPRDANALAKLAEIAIDGRRIEEATVLLRRAAVAAPTLPRQLALIRHLEAYCGAAAALKEIGALDEPSRHQFEVRAIEAAQLGMLGLHDRQIAIYAELAARQPNDPALWKTLGDALKTVGRLGEAVEALRRAIALRPTYGEAYWTLANFKAFQFTDADVAAMRKALRQKLSQEDALHFHFALGKAYEDRKQYERSFRHYADGNRIRAASFQKEAMSVTRFVDAAVATFTGEVFERYDGAGCQEEGPIFVLGLHRSGSTLIEQILASHPKIEGTTEISVMQQLWERIGRIAAASGRGTFQEIARLTRSDLAQIGAEYLERTRPFRLTDRPMFVDKLPANWMNLGLIRLALPNAKIVDARRHPMACGFSNFKQHYATGVAFSYSLDSIGRFYSDYLRMMEHFDRVQPGAVHHVLNERLIDDPEGEVRRLLDYLGLPFDPACLDFHRNRRAVRTPSAEQVRRPINRDGVDAWRHCRRWLGPLEQALGDSLDRWDRVPG